MTDQQVVDAYIAAQAALRARAGAAMAARWASLPAYNKADVPNFLALAVPLTVATQRASIAITSAFLARRLGVPQIGVAPADVVIRNGADPAEVYARPFVNVWSALGDGKPYAEAVASGAARAESAVQMDAQLTMRETLRVVGGREQRILGYRRVPDASACEFCKLIAGQRYTIEQLMPVHNHCVTGDTMVWASSSPAHGGSEASDLRGAQAATRRWYAGELVIIGTANGHDLSVTPNHPILTDRGWVAAGLLREGDSVVSGLRRDGVVGHVPYEQNVEARIEDHFGARPVAVPVTVPFAAENFHGDVGEGDVEVVATQGELDLRVLAALAQPVEHQPFATGLGLAPGLSCECGRRHRRGQRGPAPDRRVGVRSTGAPLGRSLAGGRDHVLLGATPLRHSVEDKVAADRAATHAEAFRQGEHRFSGEVQLDSVAHLRRIDWSGHVYNLVTSQGWYAANGIVTHNCGCGVDVITAENRGDFFGKRENDLNVTRDGVTAAVVEHGELGPLVVNGDDHFTDHAAIAA